MEAESQKVGFSKYFLRLKKANNIEDKWTHAYNVLRQNNATISNRYYGDGYAYAYWLYGKDKIYRQKLKGPNTANTRDKH